MRDLGDLPSRSRGERAIKPIAFVYELQGRREDTRALIDALVDPVATFLPDAIRSERPVEGAVNARFWWESSGEDVFFGHGIADKNVRNAEHLAQFGTIFHSGPKWQRKYLEQGVSPHRLRQVGYTKLDPIYGRPQKRHTVLWAPTWANLWLDGYARVERLIQRLGLEQSPHCLDAPNTVTLQALVDADVVVADGGSTIYEAWALGKPVVFPDFAIGGLISPGSIEAEIYERQVGYHAKRPGDLRRAIDRAREHGITQAERDLIDDVFPPELRGTSGKAHAEALMELAV